MHFLAHTVAIYCSYILIFVVFLAIKEPPETLKLVQVMWMGLHLESNMSMTFGNASINLTVL